MSLKPAYRCFLANFHFLDQLIKVNWFTEYNCDFFPNRWNVRLFIGQNCLYSYLDSLIIYVYSTHLNKVQPTLVIKRQHNRGLCSVGNQSANAPFQSDKFIVQIYFTLGKYMQPGAAIQVLKHFVHDWLIDAVAAHYRQNFAHAEKNRMRRFGEAYFFGAKQPAKLMHILEERRNGHCCALTI